MGTIKFLDNHATTCAPIPCTFKGCKYNGQMEDVQTHQITCPKKELQCSLCSDTETLENMESHKSKCRKRKVALDFSLTGLPNPKQPIMGEAWEQKVINRSVGAAHNHVPEEADNPYHVALTRVLEAFKKEHQTLSSSKTSFLSPLSLSELEGEGYSTFKLSCRTVSDLTMKKISKTTNLFSYQFKSPCSGPPSLRSECYSHLYDLGISISKNHKLEVSGRANKTHAHIFCPKRLVNIIFGYIGPRVENV